MGYFKYSIFVFLFRYNIVVTTRAKKDIAENEKNAQKKLMQVFLASHLLILIIFKFRFLKN